MGNLLKCENLKVQSFEKHELLTEGIFLKGVHISGKCCQCWKLLSTVVCGSKTTAKMTTEKIGNIDDSGLRANTLHHVLALPYLQLVSIANLLPSHVSQEGVTFSLCHSACRDKRLTGMAVRL